jgi:hypothetical protein
MWKQRGKAASARKVVLFSIDLTPPTFGGGPGEVRPIRGAFLKWFLHFLSRDRNEAKENEAKENEAKENEAKENARVPLNPARRRCGRSTRKLARLLAGSNSPRAYSRPHRRCSARDNGKEENRNNKDRFQTPFEGAT